MPRYMVQRTFQDGLHIPISNGGAETCATVVERNLDRITVTVAVIFAFATITLDLRLQ